MAQQPITLVDLLDCLHDQVVTRITQGDRQQLADLGTTLAELVEMTEQFGDHQIADILDDMSYVVTHTMMGVHFKAQAVLPDIDTKLQVVKRERGRE